jgi:SAM-dependent methyltransferase
MQNLEKLFTKVSGANLKGLEWNDELNKDVETIKELLPTEIKKSSKQVIYNKIIDTFGENKDLKILDYGAGGGRCVYYFRLLGYGAFGVNIQGRSRNLSLKDKLGIKEDVIFEYDGKKLPFEDDSFDFIFSEQVVEHVDDLDSYLCEAARVLKNDGAAYFSFPHKINPYDSHSRRWFAHYFPKSIRDFLWKISGKTDSEIKNLDELLNLKTLWSYKRIMGRYFQGWENATVSRLRDKRFDDSGFYDGSSAKRKVMLALFQMPFFGFFFAWIFSQVSVADIVLKSPKKTNKLY